MASKLIIDRIPPDMHIDEKGNIVWTPRLIDFNAAAYTRGHVVTADEFNTELIKQTYQGNYNTDTISVLIGLYNDLKTDVTDTANTANTNASEALAKAIIAEYNSTEAVNTANDAFTTSTEALSDVQTAVNASVNAITTAENALNISESAMFLAENASDRADVAILDAEEAVRIAETADAVAIGAEDIANEAKQIAEAANNTSNTANTNASNAVNTANAASQTANEAKSTASTAAYSAGNAVTTANTANTNASTALNTANTANTTSATALTKANEAVTTANATITTANAAKEESANAISVADTASAKIEQAVLDINEAKAVAEEAAASVADKASTGYVTEVLKDYYTSGEVDSKLSTVKVDLSDYYTKQEINNTLHAHYIPNKGWSALEGGLSIYNAEEKDVFSVGSDTDECYINIWSSSGDAYIGLNADGKLSYKYISVATPQEFVFKNALEQQYQKLPKWNTSNQADHAGQFCYASGDLYIASGGQWNLVGGDSKVNKAVLDSYLPKVDAVTSTTFTAKAGTVTPLVVKSTNALYTYIQMEGASGVLGYYGVNYEKKPVFKDTTDHELAFKSDVQTIIGLNAPTAATVGATGQFYHATNEDSDYICVGTFSDGTYNWKLVGGAKKLDTSDLLNKVYPVGSIYMSITNTSPASFLGGSWSKIGAGYALWTATSGAGGTISAGLPNITGNIQKVSGNHFLLNAVTSEATSSGAFYISSSTTTGYANSTGSKNMIRGLGFDASRMTNSLYGQSSTVQPPAYKVYAWRRTG